MRIEAKKLRYAAEATQTLFPDHPADKFNRRLKAVQDALGVLNDVATAEPLIASLRLGPAAAAAARQVVGLNAAKDGGRLEAAADAMSRLKRAKRFWKT